MIWKKVGEELVLLDYERGVYFGLDSVGARVWQLIDEVHDTDRIVETLLDEYDVARETLASDVHSLIHDLEERGLLTSL